MEQAVMNKKAIEGYGRNAVESEVNYASPYRIIQMLMEGALAKLATAKGCMERQDLAEKNRHLMWAMNIIQGLRTSLDEKQGGDIAVNLESLYEYMGRQLLEASVSNDVTLVDEVIVLLSEVKAGWDGIPSEYH